MQFPKTLTGKAILITRAASQAEEFAEAIRKRGGTPIFFPTIEIHPPESWKNCDSALARMETYDGLFFTSVNGIEFFIRRVRELHIPQNNIQNKNTFTVGIRTKSSAEKHGLTVRSLPQTFTAQQLAASLTVEEMSGKRFLFPCSNLGGRTLVAHLHSMGADVDAVTVYQTRKPQPDNVEHIRTLLTNQTIDVMTFTSPSTLKNFEAIFSQKEIKQFHSVSIIAVIGPATKEAVEGIGITPDIVAENSTVESLTQAIATYYSQTHAFGKSNTYEE